MSAQLPIDFTVARAKRRPQRPYWPTTPISRDQLAGAMRLAEQQDEAVLAIFRTTKLTEEGAAQIRLLKSQGISYRQLADRFGVAPSTVQCVVEGRTWSAEGLWALPAQGRAA